MMVFPEEPTVPSTQRIVVLGEAPGPDEVIAGKPFVGASGHLLRNTILPIAELNPNQCYIGNVFVTQPPENILKNITYNKVELRRMGTFSNLPPLGRRYIDASSTWAKQVQLTKEWLQQVKPDLIIALGGTALWLLTGDDRIGLFRGNFIDTNFGPVLGTYHPAAIQRQWDFMPFVWADLNKVKQFLNKTIDKPRKRRFYVNPTFAEIELVYQQFKAMPSTILGVDVETCPSIGQITTVSFSSETLGICIPIWNKYGSPADHNFWQSPAEEVQAWFTIKRFSELPNPKAMQNGAYDAQYFLDCPVPFWLNNWTDDTSILHHAIQPELKKSLGTLASLYLNEPSWKQMREGETTKADE